MILPAILNRRSVRSFKKDPVTNDQVKEIIKAGQFAPSAKGNHALEFLVIREQEIKDKLCAVLFQPFIKTAPILIVPILETNKSVEPVADIAVATENMFLQATHMGLGTVWKNIHKDQISDVKNILQLDEKYTVINLIPVGVPDTKPLPHSDSEFDETKIK